MVMVVMVVTGGGLRGLRRILLQLCERRLRRTQIAGLQRL